MKPKLILILIILLAAFLRLYMTDQVPPALSWDEASIGYDAYSILKTGKDQWGELFPLAFKSFGEYKYPLHIYASAVSEYFFGLNEFAVRFPSALLGLVNIFLLYIIALKIFKHQSIALTAAFLLAISPWHIQFSRVIWETNFALFFFLLGLYFFLESTLNKKICFLVVAFILFGIATFTYNAAKIFIVLFIPLLLLSQKNYLLKLKKYVIFSLIIFAGFMIVNLLDPRLSGISRFKQLGFSQADVVKTISYKTSKIYSLGKVELIAKQYLMYFSPKFLFITGDANLRHSTQRMGQVYWLELPLVLFGILFLIIKEPKWKFLILGWLLLAPIPGSFTIEAPHASRGMFMLGVWQILAASGAYYLFLVSKGFKKYLIIILFLLLFVSLINYFKYYLYEYPKSSSKYWQYGYRQVVDFVAKQVNNYDLIVLTRADGEPQVFTLFYSKYDPLKYQTDKNLEREKIGNWIQVLKFDKFYFPNLDDKGTAYEDILNQNSTKRILFIGKPGNFPADRPLLHTIYYLNGEIAFEIIDNK